jgi:hypothetical protein
MFCQSDRESGRLEPALYLPPVAAMKKYTADLGPGGELRWMVEGMAGMYVAGTYVVVAVAGGENTRLVLFTEGKVEGRSLAGRVYYMSMDPVLPFDEPVASSYRDMLARLGRDPLAFINDIGGGFVLETKKGVWGDVPDAYLPDRVKKVAMSRRKKKR